MEKKTAKMNVTTTIKVITITGEFLRILLKAFNRFYSAGATFATILLYNILLFFSFHSFTGSISPSFGPCDILFGFLDELFHLWCIVFFPLLLILLLCLLFVSVVVLRVVPATIWASWNGMTNVYELFKCCTFFISYTTLYVYTIYYYIYMHSFDCCKFYVLV